MSKMLVVYYSWARGNTRKIAEELAKAKNADIEEIQTAMPYPSDYNETVEIGQREVDAGAKRAIKPLSHDLKNYDVIAVGTPTWWYTMAPAVKTFLEGNDFSGKTVVPFMTNAGWPGHVIKDMSNLAKTNGAKVEHEMQIQFDSSGGSKQFTPQKEVDEWIKSV